MISFISRRTDTNPIVTGTEHAQSTTRCVSASVFNRTTHRGIAWGFDGLAKLAMISPIPDTFAFTLPCTVASTMNAIAITPNQIFAPVCNVSAINVVAGSGVRNANVAKGSFETSQARAGEVFFAKSMQTKPAIHQNFTPIVDLPACQPSARKQIGDTDLTIISSVSRDAYTGVARTARSMNTISTRSLISAPIVDRIAEFPRTSRSIGLAEFTLNAIIWFSADTLTCRVATAMNTIAASDGIFAPIVGNSTRLFKTWIRIRSANFAMVPRVSRIVANTLVDEVALSVNTTPVAAHRVSTPVRNISTEFANT